MKATDAIRAVVRGRAQGVGFRDATVGRARELGVMGWVRHAADGTVEVHAEGTRAGVDGLAAFLEVGPALAQVAAVELARVRVEGHEQFAIRGVSAGVFVVCEHMATTRHFDFRLEVDGVLRSWAVPRGPSMDPGARRLAVEVPDHTLPSDGFDRELETSTVIVWDRGTYEQGGRVAWPDALTRGHAVFVLHGDKLRGGFALQRTRGGAGAAAKPQWLLIKRRDGDALPGGDIVAERPGSVLTGRTLDEPVS